MKCDRAKIRAVAGKAGAAARWGEKRETKTVRVFAEDAAILERRAIESGQRIADLIHELTSRP